MSVSSKAADSLVVHKCKSRILIPSPGFEKSL